MAPSLASILAMASPNPELDPVTRARLPFSCMSILNDFYVMNVFYLAHNQIPFCRQRKNGRDPQNPDPGTHRMVSLFAVRSGNGLYPDASATAICLGWYETAFQNRA